MTVYGPYRGRIESWHDGDTCRVLVDVGFGWYLHGSDPFTGAALMSCRIWGINAPELSSPAGPASLNAALVLAPPGSMVTVVSHSWDKYGGRFDGQLTLPDGRDFAKAMLDLGQAVPML